MIHRATKVFFVWLHCHLFIIITEIGFLPGLYRPTIVINEYLREMQGRLTVLSNIQDVVEELSFIEVKDPRVRLPAVLCGGHRSLTFRGLILHLLPSVFSRRLWSVVEAELACLTMHLQLVHLLDEEGGARC